MISNQESHVIESDNGKRPPIKSQGLKVAYIMSRFPKLTETFTLYEMLAIQQQVFHLEVYPLLRERAASCIRKLCNL
jgi:hypothetical protein